MILLNKILDLLNLQIKQSNAKLPKKVVKVPKIQDNNQAIKLGAINEKSTSSVRSKTPTGAVSRRSTKSKR
jgi:hypothetical protein